MTKRVKYFCRSRSQFSFKEVLDERVLLLFVRHRAMIKKKQCLTHSQLSFPSRTHFYTDRRMRANLFARVTHINRMQGKSA